MNETMTLVTRLLLDPRNYQDGAKVVEGVTQRVTNVIEGLSGGIMSGLHIALRAAFNPIAALAGGAGLMALAHSAVEAALSFDTTRRSLEAVTGSAERAKAIMDFADKLAGPTKFLAEDLANAALRLEAFRLNTEKFLPVATSLAAVFGGSKEALLEYADALGEIQSGRAGRGMMMLERAGVTRPDLEAKGVTFSKGGELTSDVTEALDAIQQVVMERYGKLAASMADSPAARLASVMDTITKAARVAGFAILGILMPAVNQFGAFVQWLVDSGTLQRVVDGIAAMFSGKGIGNFLVEATAWFVATLMHVPQIVAAIGSAFFGLFTWLRENLLTIGRIFVGVWAFQEVFTGMMVIYRAIKAMQAAEEGLGVIAAATQAIMTDGASIILTTATAALAATAAAATFDALMRRLGDPGQIPGLKGVSDVAGSIQRDQKNMVSAFNLDQSKGPTGAANAIADGIQALLAPTQQIANHAQRTARNTDRMAEIQDKILGGGSVGKGAADAVNIDRALRGTGGGSTGDKWDRGMQLLREFMSETMGRQIVDASYQSRGGR